MPRREILTSSDRAQLLAFPEDEGEWIRRYTLTKVSAVDPKPASDGRIKTSHFFHLDTAEMFWQGMI
jgi:hypothetical protein